VTALWVALVVAAVGSYLTKLAGISLPESVLAQPRVQRVASFLPVAMLAALVAVQLADGGGHYAGARWPGSRPPSWRCCCDAASWWSSSWRSR
jgi:uncharacterized membrane protein